jgi:hypothetical protein
MYAVVFLLAAWSAAAAGQLPTEPMPSGAVTLGAPVITPAPCPGRPDVVIRWNEILLHTIKLDHTPPPLAARNMAIVHSAVYDAVIAVCPTHRFYFVEALPLAGASAEAAAAGAAHRALVALYPRQAARLDVALQQSLAAIPDARPRADGVALGEFVADRFLEWRGGDGADQGWPYTVAVAPGVWEPTPPDFRPPLLPHWPRVTCFAMRSADQFRPRNPPALASAEYAVNFNEVKALGAVNSLVRTPEQTTIAYFWADGDGTVTPPGHWNRIAEDVAVARGTSLTENARLFALLNIALADAAICCWDCKYHHSFWRPVTAIHRAAEVGNPGSVADPNWSPLLPTPPFPSYTSGHSSFSGAAAAALACFFGSDRVSFTSRSDSLPGGARSYASFWSAAEEAGRSRIYGGIHYEFDNREGLAAGRALGLYVCGNFLPPRSTPADHVTLRVPSDSHP